MVDKKHKSPRETLRSRAEKTLSKQKLPRVPKADVQKLIHERQIHQIELEMQNDELRSKQIGIEQARDRYLDFYDFAPVGYFTFDQKGKIVEVNLTGASLLGVPRSRLIGRLFTLFLEDDFINSFLRHLKEISSGELLQTTELRIRRADTKSLIDVLFHSVAIRSTEEIRFRSAVTDITERKLAEEELFKARQELTKTNERLRYLSNRLLTVQEEERGRIALEVHDNFTSPLTAIKYRLEDIPAELKNRYHLEEVSNELEAAIGQARRIQTSLRPSALDDLGIAPALNWYCREFQKNYPHINIEKQLQLGEDKIPDSIKIAIYRIAQEALNNTARLSKANCVRLSLTKKKGAIDLVIEDNGQGFDVEIMLSGGSPHQGFGLSSMRERAALSGGLFHVESVPGEGTIVRASWPTPQPLPVGERRG